MKSAPEAALPARVVTWEAGTPRDEADWLAIEQPLEIHVAGAPPLVVMRTPGHDRELAAGLLFSEGVVQAAGDIVAIEPSGSDGQLLRVLLRSQARARLARLARTSIASSACGVCGKRHFEPPEPPARPPREPMPRTSPSWLLSLPARLHAGQEAFAATGGLHAAALFATGGELLALHEDVGRHNALDKLIGHALLQGTLPWEGHALALSGRASYELLQRAIRTRVPIVCALSAPSSYAVELARAFGVTLVGFLRAQRFKVYSGAERIEWAPRPERSPRQPERDAGKHRRAQPVVLAEGGEAPLARAPANQRVVP